MFDDEERVEPVQGDGVEVKQVRRPGFVRLDRKETPGSRWVRVRRGEGSMPALRRIFQMVEAPIW